MLPKFGQSVLRVLLLLAIGTLRTAGATHSGPKAPPRGSSSEYPCPEAAAIAPCVCGVEEDGGVSLDCSDVTSNQQLVSVFEEDIPVKGMASFTIRSNEHVTQLGDTFNGVTFRSITLDGLPNLRFVSQYFLHGCEDTLEELTLYYVPLMGTASFPFLTLDHYSRLTEIHMTHANLTQVPEITSASLEYLSIHDNPIRSVPAGELVTIVYLTRWQRSLLNSSFADVTSFLILFQCYFSCKILVLTCVLT